MSDYPRVMPDGYPFPGDEVVWSSAYEDTDPDSDSYILLAALPEDHEVVVNGRKHENDHRLVIHSPLRGTEAFLVSAKNDSVGLLQAAVALMGRDESAHGGAGKAIINPDFIEHKTGVLFDTL